MGLSAVTLKFFYGDFETNEEKAMKMSTVMPRQVMHGTISGYTGRKSEVAPPSDLPSA